VRYLWPDRTTCCMMVAVRRRIATTLIASVLVGLALAPEASAITVTVGRADMSTAGDGFLQPAITSFFAATKYTSPDSLTAVPADGRVVRWRALGGTCGSGVGVSFAALRPSAGGQLTLVGMGPSVKGTFTPSSPMTLPAPIDVRAGDLIGWFAAETGFDCLGNTAIARIETASRTGSSVGQANATISPGQSAMFNPIADREAMINADVVLDPPTVSSVSPAAGPTGGGQSVAIRGAHLSPQTRVSFGGVPARALAVVSANELRVVTPAHTGGTVPVTVTTVGGSSSAGSYTFVPPDVTKPVVSSLTFTRSRFQAANTGPDVIAAAVGSTILYRLSENATTSLQVQRSARGYKVGKRCRAKAPKKGKRKRCTRWRNVRRPLTHQGRAGLNELRFMGRVHGHTLKPGRYRLRVTARDASGNASAPRTRSFRIIK
jgi:hypothetical protein